MTPEEQEAVRRALAATPPAGPMPPEVVARLEATIADLTAVRAAEESAPEPGGTVSDLEQRRRRRWPRVLVAAASVALVGYGVGAVVQDAAPNAETAASDSAAGGSADEGEAESSTDRDAGGDLTAEEVEPPAPLDAPRQLDEGRVVTLGASTLRRDVLRHLRSQRSTVTADGLAELDAKRYARRDGTCTLPEVRDGDDVAAALLDGRRATLVVRAPSGGTRVAEVYWCGDGRTLLAETWVPARR